jgi:PTS system mannose-specific IIA component
VIGVVIVTHSGLAKDFLQATETIVGELTNFRAVSLRSDEAVESMTDRIRTAIEDVHKEQGVVVLTDMFGGTPSNLSLTFHEEGKVEVVMGVNLPMLIKLGSMKPEDARGISEVAAFITDYGKRNIQFASEILRKRPGTGGASA